MRKSSLLLLSPLFLGFALYVGQNIGDLQIGYGSKKEPPGIKTVDLAYLNAADRTITNEGTNNYFISYMQMGKGSPHELSDDLENRSISINKIRGISYKTNNSGIIIKKNEFI